MNHTAQERLGWRTPTEWLLGYTPDITVLLQFSFWEPVYYARNEDSWPSDPSEELGRFVGIADVVGAAITFKILTEKMRVISRSIVRTATKGGEYLNRRANARAPRLAPKPVSHNVRIDGDVQPVVIDDNGLPSVAVETVEEETVATEPEAAPEAEEREQPETPPTPKDVSTGFLCGCI